MTSLSRLYCSVFLLALVILAALAGGPTSAVELRVMQRFAELRATFPSATSAVLIITALGGVHLTLGLASLASVWLLLQRAPGRALLLSGTVISERLLIDGLKDLIGRPRPAIEVDWLPSSLAFPSGHAANSMTAFMATALIALPRRHRQPAVIAALFAALAVGLSRIYLGVHWPSDVIGGWALGLLAVGAALAIGERSGALRLEPQHHIVRRHRQPLDEDEAA